MKRMISCLLLLCAIIFVYPVNVEASAYVRSSDLGVREEIISAACEIFPEYASKIVCQPENLINTMSLSSEKSIVVSESRNYAENRIITYTEYSDGLVVLADSDYSYTQTINNQVVDGNKTHVTLTVRATCNVVSGYFELRNVKFTIYGSSYDKITDVGSYVTSGNCQHSQNVHTPILNETASTKATIQHRINWRFSSYPGGWIVSMLTIEVGNNVFRVTHLDDL